MENTHNSKRISLPFHSTVRNSTVRYCTCIEAVPANPKHRHAHESYEDIVWFESFFTKAFAIANDKHSGEAGHTCA